MKFNCKNCKNKITINEDDGALEGKLITCQICKEEWIHHSNTFFLESRLTELEQDLNKKELQINNQNSEHNIRINLLEKELINKKNELDKQRLLEEKVLIFESRITDTEKLNSEQADLETKVFELEKIIKKTSDEIFDKNKSIDKKANYLEMKANTIHNRDEKEKKIIINDKLNDVVNFRSYEEKKKTSDEMKKKSFFWTGKNDE